jgi:hypothetical protein
LLIKDRYKNVNVKKNDAPGMFLLLAAGGGTGEEKAAPHHTHQYMLKGNPQYCFEKITKTEMNKSWWGDLRQ